MRIPITREGVPFILPLVAVAIILLISGFVTVGIVFLGISLFVTYFFRDPLRLTPTEEGAVVSPADGRVLSIDKCREEEFLNEEVIKISIFMSIFNIHINRVPISGRVISVRYRHGKFLLANKDKASIYNERNAILMENGSGNKFLVIQIAGAVARRIVCYLKEGGNYNAGDKLGLIRFGSRLDVYLPADYVIQTKVRQKVKGGMSVIAKGN